MADWTVDFLASLALVPNVSEACRQAGITRTAAYKRRDADPEFAAAWDAALDESIDDLVGECYRRAKAGSDTLAIFLLKAHRRRLYGDKLQADVTSAGQPLGVTVYIPANGRDDGPGDPPQLDPPGDVPRLPR